MTVCLCHDSSDGVSTFADDVAMVSVTHIHLHGDPAVGAGVQHLADHHLGPHHTLLSSSPNSNVRILLAFGSNF